MSSNILKALLNISKGTNDLKEVVKYENRIVNVGYALETYIRDAFCAVPGSLDDAERDNAYSVVFSYLANQNNPPDAMIKTGDAIEIKKINGWNSGDVALNSSYPRSKLYSNSTLITQKCRDAEKGWKEKDMIYAIGNIVGKKIGMLSFVYGDCYAADKEVYEKVASTVKNSIELEGLEAGDTRELGRVNRVDPLGITYLRVRGMWGIKAPASVFKQHIKIDKNKEFIVFAIMKSQKYLSFSKEDRKAIEYSDYEVNDIKIKDPNNAAKLVDSKLITLTR